MSLTPARIDLPKEGDRIAALHGSGQWYFGPLTVVKSVYSTRVVEVWPEYWKRNRTMVFTPSEQDPTPLKWNLLDDLTPEERATMMVTPLPEPPQT